MLKVPTWPVFSLSVAALLVPGLHTGSRAAADAGVAAPNVGPPRATLRILASKKSDPAGQLTQKLRLRVAALRICIEHGYRRPPWDPQRGVLTFRVPVDGSSIVVTSDAPTEVRALRCATEFATALTKIGLHTKPASEARLQYQVVYEAVRGAPTPSTTTPERGSVGTPILE